MHYVYGRVAAILKNNYKISLISTNEIGLGGPQRVPVLKYSSVCILYCFFNCLLKSKARNIVSVNRF